MPRVAATVVRTARPRLPPIWRPTCDEPAERSGVLGGGSRRGQGGVGGHAQADAGGGSERGEQEAVREGGARVHPTEEQHADRTERQTDRQDSAGAAAGGEPAGEHRYDDRAEAERQEGGTGTQRRVAQHVLEEERGEVEPGDRGGADEDDDPQRGKAARDDGPFRYDSATTM
nr:hypothetical protein [Streptomyces sp. Amel2xC10]